MRGKDGSITRTHGGRDVGSKARQAEAITLAEASQGTHQGWQSFVDVWTACGMVIVPFGTFRQTHGGFPCAPFGTMWLNRVGTGVVPNIKYVHHAIASNFA